MTFFKISAFFTGSSLHFSFSVMVQPDDLSPDYTNQPQHELFCAWWSSLDKLAQLASFKQ